MSFHSSRTQNAIRIENLVRLFFFFSCPVLTILASPYRLFFSYCPITYPCRFCACAHAHVYTLLSFSLIGLFQIYCRVLCRLFQFFSFLFPVSPRFYTAYRDNKLTMLMQDSIGGNSKTLMFVNISPASDSTIETKNSLQYAKRVKRIHNNTEKVTETKRTLKLQSMARERTALLWSAYFSVTSGLIVPGDPSSLDPMIVELFQDADPEYFRRMLQESRAERALQTESDELFPSSTNADLALMDGDAELSTPTRDSFPGVASTSFS